jgi:hypothetical protein
MHREIASASRGLEARLAEAELKMNQSAIDRSGLLRYVLCPHEIQGTFDAARPCQKSL